MLDRFMVALRHALEALERMVWWRFVALLATILFLVGFYLFTSWYPKDIREAYRENGRLGHDLELTRRSLSEATNAKNVADQMISTLKKQLDDARRASDPGARSQIEQLRRELEAQSLGHKDSLERESTRSRRAEEALQELRRQLSNAEAAVRTAEDARRRQSSEAAGTLAGVQKQLDTANTNERSLRARIAELERALREEAAPVAPTRPSAPQGTPPDTKLQTAWKRVCTQARSADEAQRLLSQRGVQALPVVVSMVERWSPTERCFEVSAPVSGRVLGDEQNFTYDVVAKKASALGARLCSWEEAVAIRLSTLDQELGTAFRVATELSPRASGDFRLPLLGNGPSRSETAPTFKNPYQGYYFTTSIIGKDDHVLGREYVFCR